MSANKTTKREKGKKRKKITLNSRISPPGKRYDYLLLFRLCFVKGGTFLSFFSPTAKGGLSHPNTHRHPISFSLFLSLIYNKYISENNNNNAPKNSSARAHSRCAHTSRKRRCLKERKRNTTQNWIPNPTDRERKKKKKSSLVSLFKTRYMLNKKPYLDANGVSSGTSRDYLLFERE